jgi:hypothetical protein
MTTIEVNIINPKAGKLLKDLADMNLISIREKSENSFSKLAKKIRAKAKDNAPTMLEITKEVEAVRSKRYAKK